MFWPTILRPLLFCLPPEPAHYFTMGCFSLVTSISPLAALVRRRYAVRDPRLVTELFGLTFQNPVGLAAGFDKDARWHQQLANLGFGHVEVGTITGEAQAGNPKPRLFRLAQDQALINRMGFNNSGSQFAAKRLESSTPNRNSILGINIGKTKVVALDQAPADYLKSLERLFPFADYLTINVSSPNTPGLRELQGREPLLRLIESVSARNRQLADAAGCAARPILLKIAPDLNADQVADIASIAATSDLAGIIATNTTIDRANLATSKSRLEQIGGGGLSGKPLTQRSRDLVGQLYSLTNGKLPIIGVGGIMNGEDAWQMILAGASMVQIYTGFIYGGPGITRDINRYLVRKMDENNLSSISQAVGGKPKFD